MVVLFCRQRAGIASRDALVLHHDCAFIRKISYRKRARCGVKDQIKIIRTENILKQASTNRKEDRDFSQLMAQLRRFRMTSTDHVFKVMVPSAPQPNPVGCE